MNLNISIELANQIIAYLAGRPYQEVFQLIDGIKDAAKPPVLKESQNGEQMDSKGGQ